jgi:spermidine synthase
MTFPIMTEIIPESTCGVAAIEHFEVSEQASRFSSIRGATDYVPAGKYARLSVHGQLMMTDTPMEHMTNYEFVRKANGDVLVAGLGLGMILHPIMESDKILSVTVVEKYADVIALVSPTVQHPKLTIVNADIYEWKPAKGTKFDTIYFDIWAEQSTDTLEDMKKLHLRFRSCKSKDGWMDSWRRDYLKYQKQRDNRNRWGY